VEVSVKIILKPAGALIVVAAVATLGFLAFRKAGQDSSPSMSPPPQRTVSAPEVPAGPLTPVAFPKTVAEGWRLSGDGKTLEKLDTNNGECPLPGATLKPDTGLVQIKVSCEELAPNAKFPKFGLRVKGTPEGDELDVWIDPQAKVLTTRGRVGGTNYDWHPSPLPEGFDMAKEHTLSIQWSASGKEWKFMVDDDRHSSQSKHLFAQMKPASPMVIAYLAKPIYRELATR
jgi:hypothetical protein